MIQRKKPRARGAREAIKVGREIGASETGLGAGASWAATMEDEKAMAATTIATTKTWNFIDSIDESTTNKKP